MDLVHFSRTSRTLASADISPGGRPRQPWRRPLPAAWRTSCWRGGQRSDGRHAARRSRTRPSWRAGTHRTLALDRLAADLDLYWRSARGNELPSAGQRFVPAFSDARWAGGAELQSRRTLAGMLDAPGSPGSSLPFPGASGCLDPGPSPEDASFPWLAPASLPSRQPLAASPQPRVWAALSPAGRRVAPARPSPGRPPLQTGWAPWRERVPRVRCPAPRLPASQRQRLAAALPWRQSRIQTAWRGGTGLFA